MSAYAGGCRAEGSEPLVVEWHDQRGLTPRPVLAARAERPAPSGPADVLASAMRPAPSGAIPARVFEGDCPAGLTVLATSERAVLEGLVVGGTDRAIAKALSVGTAGVDEVSWCVRKLIKRVGHQTTRAGLVAIALRHRLVDHPEPPHPGRLPDDVMALLWSMASGRTFKAFVKESGFRTWEAERLRTALRHQLQQALPAEEAAIPLTPCRVVYLAWPALAEAAQWPRSSHTVPCLLRRGAVAPGAR